MKKGFTLAEVLITLAIIGIVAALTIPTLVQNYQERAWGTSAAVFERKLEEALKVMNTQQVLAGYKTTTDFVNALTKYIKIEKVCSNNDMLSCFEDTVIWGSDNEEVDMTKIKNSKNFGLKEWKTETVGLQFANGTTAVLAYNPECRQDPYNNQHTVTSCIAILYDTTGYKTPNASGKDVNSINVQSLGSGCAIELSDGTCFKAPIDTEPMSYEECAGENAISPRTLTPAGQMAAELGIIHCYYEKDYWAAAVKACGGIQNMPTKKQLIMLANDLYNTNTIGDSGKADNLSLDYEKVKKMGITPNVGYAGGLKGFGIWSGEEKSTSGYEVYVQQFKPKGADTWFSRGASYTYGICLDK